MFSNTFDAVTNFVVRSANESLYYVVLTDDMKFEDPKYGSIEFTQAFLQFIQDFIKEDVHNLNHLKEYLFVVMSHWLTHNHHFDSASYKLISETITSTEDSRLARKINNCADKMFINMNGVTYFKEMYERFGSTSFGRFKSSINGVDEWIQLQLEIGSRNALGNRLFPFNRLIDDGTLTFDNFHQIYRNIEGSTGSSIPANLYTHLEARETPVDDVRWVQFAFNNLGLKRLSHSQYSPENMNEVVGNHDTLLEMYYKTCFRLMVRPNRDMTKREGYSLSNSETGMFNKFSIFLMHESGASEDKKLEILTLFAKQMPVIFYLYVFNVNTLNEYSSAFAKLMLGTLLSCDPHEFDGISLTLLKEMVEASIEDIDDSMKSKTFA